MVSTLAIEATEARGSQLLNHSQLVFRLLALLIYQQLLLLLSMLKIATSYLIQILM